MSNHTTKPKHYLPPMYGENNPSWKGGKITKPCVNCGNDIWRYKSQFKKSAYCDRNCQREWESNNPKKEHPNWKGHTVTCSWCGEVTQRSPSLINRQKDFFCNMNCRAAWLSEMGMDVYKKDNNHNEIVSKLRDRGMVVMETHMVGYGFPDVCVATSGKNYLFEIKNPDSGNGLTEGQKLFHTEWTGQIDIVTCIEDAWNVLGIIGDEAIPF